MKLMDAHDGASHPSGYGSPPCNSAWAAFFRMSDDRTSGIIPWRMNPTAR